MSAVSFSEPIQLFSQRVLLPDGLQPALLTVAGGKISSDSTTRRASP